jgi:hypothetical protein
MDVVSCITVIKLKTQALQMLYPLRAGWLSKINLALFLLIWSSEGAFLYAQSTQTKKTMKQYPKIEVYTEVNKGNPQAGSNTWTDPLGKKVYGGRADYRPSIRRMTYTLNDEQTKQLLEVPLNFLPYFKEQKNAVPLVQYFEAKQQKNTDLLRSMLPQSLEGLYSQKDNEYYRYWNTLVLYELTHPRSIVVVWLDASTWYVDKVYYTCEGMDALLKQVTPQEDFPWEGSMMNFLNASPVFQRNLSEGYSFLIPETTSSVLPPTGEVLEYALSPGMPNTISYRFKLSAEGVFDYTVQLSSGQAQIDPVRLTTFFMNVQKMDWKRYLNLASVPPAPPVPANDRQTRSLSIWYNGKIHRLREHEFPKGDNQFEEFCKFVLDFFEPELRLSEDGTR